MSMKRGVPEADVRIRAARHVWLPILLMGCFFLRSLPWRGSTRPARN